MDFPDNARRAERPAPRKSLVERAAAIFETARAPEAPRADNTDARPATPPQPAPPAAEALQPAPAPAQAAPAAAPAWAPEAAEPPTDAAAAKRVTRKQIELNFSRLREKGYVVPGDRSTTAEEIRLIKRPLLRHAFADGRRTDGTSNLIMVTSARPSEGKTFMAVNLALSMALEKDITVLLIDADVAQPAIPGVLGFESDRGLLDLLVDPTLDMSDVMIRTNLDNLSILPAGRDTPNANELLASSKMEALVKDIAERYPDRVIIFDTPPVLVRTETSVLASHVGQVAFVIEAEQTNETAVKESLELLNGCSNIGLILNELRSSYGTERFGQYYGRYKR